MENLVTIVITLAVVLYSAYRKSKRQNQNDPLPRDSSWDAEEISEDDADGDSMENAAPQPPDPLQDLIRKFKEEQAKSMRGEVPSAPIPQKKIVEAEQKTFSEEISSSRREFEHQAKKIESASPAPAPVHMEYAPTKDFTRVTRPKFEEVKSVFEENSDALENSDEGILTHEISMKQSSLCKAKFDMDIKEARKGFLWAKVLDDPRFKRRSPYPFTLGRRG